MPFAVAIVRSAQVMGSGVPRDAGDQIGGWWQVRRRRCAATALIVRPERPGGEWRLLLDC